VRFEDSITGRGGGMDGGTNYEGWLVLHRDLERAAFAASCVGGCHVDGLKGKGCG
jgi:hypothetical protein